MELIARALASPAFGVRDAYSRLVEPSESASEVCEKLVCVLYIYCCVLASSPSRQERALRIAGMEYVDGVSCKYDRGAELNSLLGWYGRTSKAALGRTVFGSLDG